MKKRLLSTFTALLMMCSMFIYLPDMSIKASAANTADSLVAIAEGELGKTDGTKYAKACWAIDGSYNYAWCAAFVSWCARQAGVDSIPTQTSCSNMYNRMVNNNHCHELESGETPQKGDIVFFYCTSCQSWCHVGIMVDSAKSIDGNYGSKVSYDTAYSDGKHSTSTGVVTKTYVRPNYDDNVSPPTWAKVSIDYPEKRVGENVTFELSSDTGRNFTVGIDDADGNRIDTHDTNLYEYSYTRSFDKPGIYSCYITTYNDHGYCDSDRIYFIISDGKPSFAKVDLRNREYNVGEDVTFELSTDTGRFFTIGIDNAAGERLYTYDTEQYVKTYTRSFDRPGKYSCYVTI